MKTSSAGIELIKKWEGCRTEAYKCAAGVWTIGYGHTKGVTQHDKITMQKAEQYLMEDIQVCEYVVGGLDAKYHWNQNQYDALISFTFNCGAANFTKLTQNGKRTVQEIAEKLTSYCRANGKVLDGLLRRRKEEKALFLSTVIKEPLNAAQPSYSSFQEWVKLLQTACCEEYNKTQKIDGIPGKITLSCCPILKTGARGNVVGVLQQRLNDLGFSCGNTDKIFGTKTDAAVRAYQKSKSIKQDGIVGKDTWTKLLGL